MNLKKMSAIALLSLICAFPPFSAARASAEGKPFDLIYNAADDFSETGSAFWNYYYVNDDSEGKSGKLLPHGAGLFGNYYADGSLGYEHKFVVGPSDYVSDEYHRYLEVWGGVILHPGEKADVVVSFVAPVDGTVDISADIKGMDPSSDGVKIYATLNGFENSIYEDGKDYVLHGASDLVFSVNDLRLKRGDEVFFRVNKNQTLAFDATYFSPTVRYSEYSLPPDFALSLGVEEMTVEKGAIRLIDAEINVDLGQKLDYSYFSSDESVATVRQNGLVYAVGEGVAEILVRESASGLSAKCVVNVTGENGPGKASGGCAGGIPAAPSAWFAFFAAAAIMITEAIKG